MRGLRSISKVSLAALALLSGGCGAANAEGSGKACQAAEAVLPLANADGPPPLFSDAPRDHGRQLADEDLRGGWSGRAPSLSTVRNFKRAPAVSALTCQGVARLARQRGEVVTFVQGRARLDAMGLVMGKTGYLYSLSLPVFDDPGQEALIEIASSTNHLGGGVDLLLLAKQNGRWTVVGRKAVLLG